MLPRNPADGIRRPPPISMWYPRGKSSFLLSSHHGTYRCMPPTPSSLCGTPLASFGMEPETERPVESVKYRPTTPLEFARPLGKRGDFELRSMRADSQALG